MGNTEQIFETTYEKLIQGIETCEGSDQENLNLVRKLEGMLPNINHENKDFYIQQINKIREHYGIPLMRV